MPQPSTTRRKGLRRVVEGSNVLSVFLAAARKGGAGAVNCLTELGPTQCWDPCRGCVYDARVVALFVGASPGGLAARAIVVAGDVGNGAATILTHLANREDWAHLRAGAAFGGSTQ